MSVLIKNMGIPSSCADCQGYINNGNSCWCVLIDKDIDNKNKRDEDCPLIEVPTPHGRLIDAKDAYEVMMFEMSGTGYQSNACQILKSDLYTPTVIEAEE